MRFIRKAGAPADKSPKRLHVEPAELASKLIKEMDDHTVTRGDRVWVRNRYVVYLCTEDHENLTPRRAQLTADLTRKLAKHVHDMGYLLQGGLTVEMAVDQDLELGYFGILAQRVYPQEPGAQPASQEALLGAPLVAGASAGVPPAAAAGAAAATGMAAETAIPAGTEVLAAKQSEELGLARRVIVVTTGGQVREFTQSRVVLGRSKEADLRIDDPNISRKHAAIYWNNDRLIIEDLGSTNGTLVNGYPVTSTVLRPRDVVAVGDSRLTVESK
jgi:hypothetical protein